jgi:restriction system protein
MALSPMINQIVRIVVLYLIPIAIFTAILKSPWFKGLAGEFIVNTLAKMILNKNEYHLIKNVTLPTEDGTTQIDHIIVSRYGIFVVETKNMKGWIFGSPSQKQFTQKIYKYSKHFQNPLNQNYKHLKTIESLLGLNDQQVHSVIVFVGESTFKTEMPANVTYGFGYIRFIKSKKQTILTKSKVDEIIKKIEEGKLTPSFKTNKAHIEHVKHIVSEKKMSNMCPKCGNPMVLREAKSGQNAGKQFWGCSKFPQCRGVVNVT